MNVFVVMEFWGHDEPPILLGAYTSEAKARDACAQSLENWRKEGESPHWISHEIEVLELQE